MAFVIAAGCGGEQTPLGEVFREENSTRSLAKIEGFLRPVLGKKESTPIAIGVTQSAILGQPLTGGSGWRFDHPVSSRPEISGTVIVGVGGGEVFALRASDGTLLWTRPSGGMELLGAGDDGSTTVVSLRSSAGRWSMLLAMDRDGQVQRQLETEQHLGRPAVLRGIAFIPWANRHVTAYDILLGQEVARLSMHRGLSNALLDQGNLLFGAQSLVRLDEQLARWPADELPRAEIPEIPLLSTPRMVPRLEDTRALRAGPTDQLRVYARATPIGEPIGLLRGRFYFSYHQVLLAQKKEGELPIWVRLLEQPMIGGDVFRGGLALCGEDGHVLLLGESHGTTEANFSLGQPVLSCIVQGGSLERFESGTSTESLTTQIATLLQAQDPQLAPLQYEMLSLLGYTEDAQTTRIFINFYLDPNISTLLKERILLSIEKRKQGIDAMLTTLERPATSLEEVSLVAALTKALLSLRESRIVPLLLIHLENTLVDSKTVQTFTGAIEELSTKREISQLRRAFDRLRRSTSLAQQQATIVIAKTLLRLDKQHSSRLIQSASTSLATAEPLRAQLISLLLVQPKKK